MLTLKTCLVLDQNKVGGFDGRAVHGHKYRNFPKTTFLGSGIGYLQRKLTIDFCTITKL